MENLEKDQYYAHCNNIHILYYKIGTIRCSVSTAVIPFTLAELHAYTNIIKGICGYVRMK